MNIANAAPDTTPREDFAADSADFAFSLSIDNLPAAAIDALSGAPLPQIDTLDPASLLYP